MPTKTILDMFHQDSDCGIPSHWCVQFYDNAVEGLKYEYFHTWTEANEFATSHGYND